MPEPRAPARRAGHASSPSTRRHRRRLRRRARGCACSRCSRRAAAPMPAAAFAAGARLAPGARLGLSAAATAARLLAFRDPAPRPSAAARCSPSAWPPTTWRPSTARERAFLHELVLGTLRHRGRLDHALAAARPIARSRELDAADAHRAAPRRLPGPAPARPRPRGGLGVGGPRARGGAAGGGVRERRPAPAGPRRRAAGARPGRRPLGWLTTIGSLPRLAGRALAGPARRRGGASRARARFWSRAADRAPRSTRASPTPRRGVAAAGIAPRAAAPCPARGGPRAARPARSPRTGVVYVQDQGSQMVAHLAARDGPRARRLRRAGRKVDAPGRSRPRGAASSPARSRRPRLAHPGRPRPRAGARRTCTCVGADARRPPFARRLRLRPPRRALQRPRHARPPPRHPLARARRGPRPPRRAPARAARRGRRPGGAGRHARLRDVQPRAGGERRTWSSRSWRRIPSSRRAAARTGRPRFADGPLRAHAPRARRRRRRSSPRAAAARVSAPTAVRPRVHGTLSGRPRAGRSGPRDGLEPSGASPSSS